MDPRNTTIDRRIYLGEDNLDVLRNLDAESIDLIYHAPPFDGGGQYGAPARSAGTGVAFKEAGMLDNVKEEWACEIEERNPMLHYAIRAVGLAAGSHMHGYLTFMSVRLLEMQRVLKANGSIYFHCNDGVSHYIKIIMDAVFGATNFRNAITWKRTSTHDNSQRFERVSDTILFYSGRNLNKDAITGRIPTDMWDDITPLLTTSKGMAGYPVQKPLALLDRIIHASSDEGDIVLDPIWGLGTTCVAAERLGRKWIGIELPEVASQIITDRLAKDLGCPRCDDSTNAVLVSEGSYSIKCDLCKSPLLRRLRDHEGLFFELGRSLEGQPDPFGDDERWDNSPIR